MAMEYPGVNGTPCAPRAAFCGKVSKKTNLNEITFFRAPLFTVRQDLRQVDGLLAAHVQRSQIDLRQG